MRLLTFGEVMLRLSPPGRELLLQTPRLEVYVGGAEANVAIALARLDHDVSFVSRVPDGDLGRAALATLRGHGVNVAGMQFGGERMGLYFATSGTGMRATEVIYDRAGSSFATAPSDSWNWAELLHGVDRLHVSGITPALGDEPARSALDAVRAAGERGITVSFDGNWRGKLWERRAVDPAPILRDFAEAADLLFGNWRDIALLTGARLEDGAESARRAAEVAFEAFPKLRMIASTRRRAVQADRHLLSARIDTREAHAQTGEAELSGVVDRIGAGDAFASGVLFGLMEGWPLHGIAEAGLGLACLKHSLPGDASLFRRADLEAMLAGGYDVRR